LLNATVAPQFECIRVTRNVDPSVSINLHENVN
jgi:hypothetical protein